MLLERGKSQVLMVDVQERLLPAMADPTLVLKNGGRLLEAARILAVPVVVSEQYPAGLGRTVPELANLAPANAMHEKVEFSCFANPALHAALSAPARQTVIFGIEAHVCVLQTAPGGQLIDTLHELGPERDGDLVALVLGLDLRGHLLPIEDSVGRDHADPDYACP